MSIITPFVLLITGVIIGISGIIPGELLDTTNSLIKGFVILLCFVIGMDMGKDQKLWANIRNMGHKAFIIPIVSVLGSLMGGIITGILVGTAYWSFCCRISW